MSIQEKYRDKAPLPPDTLRRISLLSPLFARHCLRLVYLFGSAADETSQIETCQDIDLAIMPRAAFDFRAFYADISQTLLTDRLDIVDMRYASISLLFTIVSHHRCLFCAEGEDTRAFEHAIRCRFRDFIARSKQRERALQERLRQ